MLTPDQLFGILTARPFPGAVDLRMTGGACCFTVEGVAIGYTHNGWLVFGRVIADEWPIPLDFVSDAERVHAEIRRVLAIVNAPAVEPTKIARMSPGHLGGDLLAHPFPGAIDLRLTTDGLHFTVGDITLRYDGEAFHAPRHRVESTLPHPAAINAQGVHAEIHRVLAIVKGAMVPDTASTDRLQDRLTDEMDRRRNVEAQLAQVTAERDAALAAPAQRLAILDDILTRLGAKSGGALEALDRLDLTIETLRGERDKLLVAESTLSKIAAALAIPALEPHDDALSMVRRLVDGYTVVSQRLVGSQKEVAEVTKRATKAEARVKRLLRQRSAAHDVLDEAGIGLEPEGSPRWTLARRCRAAVEPVWGYLDALQAFDVVGESVGVTGKTGERGFMDAVIARVKALHQEDADLLRLVSYHQAPIKFNNRPLTLAERAAFVIRRLWQGRTNAAAEAAALRRELGDIADALGDLPDTAEREPIGDREDHIGLSTAERIWLSR